MCTDFRETFLRQVQCEADIYDPTLPYSQPLASGHNRDCGGGRGELTIALHFAL